jgi:chromosome partitioning protein
VLIPVQASFLALHGLRQLTQTVAAVREHSNPRLHIGGVLLTMYDSRTLHAVQVRERVCEFFREAVFETLVRRSVVFDYATVAGAPLVHYRPTHPCAQVYRDLAQEVMARA